MNPISNITDYQIHHSSRRLERALQSLARTVFLYLTSASLLAGAMRLWAAADLYMQDTPADTGVEPNPDSGPMYVSQDIWVRQNAIPGYQPYAFGADPGWLTAISPLHQNPEYRDPRYSKPNYIYVRVRNRGSTASSGSERLRVYWAKASTGLSWPVQWEDYKANFCGPSKLYGIELTKPRKNAATASPAERTAYVNAVLGAATIKWTADLVSYFSKQDQIHELAAQHGVPSFLPWHREMMSRYEVLLRETDPTVTLLYWDWTTDPVNSTGGVDLMTAAFMGAANGVVGAPFSLSGFTANGVCGNARAGLVFSTSSFCSLHSGDWTFPPPELYRGKAAGLPGTLSDGTVLAPANFPTFRGMEGNPHGTAHVYMGSLGGNIGSVPTAAEDPFFFLLHANVDRLWAMWQRDISSVSRRDAATCYGTESGTLSITGTMPPWDGSSSMPPWTGSPGDFTYGKTSLDASVVDAPVYDTAPLTIPVLQAGESCVIEIPWFPPNPADFSCFGSDQGHVCLLARIETSNSAPFGMTFAEGADVDVNTRNNNNIVWRNVTVQDFWPGPLMIAPTWLRNLSVSNLVQARLQINMPSPDSTNGLFTAGTLLLNLGPVLYPRWLQNGAVGQGIERGAASNAVQVLSPGAFLSGIPLAPGEVQQVELQFRLIKNYPHPQGKILHVDLEQYNEEAAAPQFIGGQRAQFDFNKLDLVRAGSSWRYFDTGQYPGPAWTGQNYNDSDWPSGKAELGYGGGDEATPIRNGSPGAHYITTWFRQSFALTDPTLYRNLWLRLRAADSAVVYLNGTEIYRVNLPAGIPITPTTPASTTATGLVEKSFFPVNVSFALQLLATGTNVVAVEVHQASPASPELSFDLELLANLGTAQFPPVVELTKPENASLFLVGKSISLQADALDPDGSFVLVAFYADGQSLGVSQQAPYSVTWSNPPAGHHQLSVVATDVSGLRSSAFAVIQVLSNLPPIVNITNPNMDAIFKPGDPIPVGADASDPNGSVQKVELYLRPHEAFTGLGQLVGTDLTSPYVFPLSAPAAAGRYVLTAVATDDQGTWSQSEPVHVLVALPPTLTIHLEPPMVVVDWTPPDAILETAPAVTGPWTVMQNASPPLRIVPQGSMFFRAHLP